MLSWPQSSLDFFLQTCLLEEGLTLCLLPSQPWSPLLAETMVAPFQFAVSADVCCASSHAVPVPPASFLPAGAPRSHHSLPHHPLSQLGSITRGTRLPLAEKESALRAAFAEGEEEGGQWGLWWGKEHTSTGGLLL